MNENPYSQPETEVAASTGGELQLGASRSRPIGHGWTWISQAWSLFTPAWGQWILVWLMLFIFFWVLSIIPFGPLVASLVGPVFGAGVLYMAHRARSEGGCSIGDVFAPFQQRPGPLVGLGAINLAVTTVILVIVAGGMFLAVDVQALEGVDPDNQEAVAEAMMAMFTSGGAIFALFGLALLIPWFAAYWFALPLVYFGEYGIGTALKTSLIAVVRNILPLLWYSIILFVLAILAAIPFALGYLVLMPLMMITFYTMFRDIFSPDA